MGKANICKIHSTAGRQGYGISIQWNYNITTCENVSTRDFQNQHHQVLTIEKNVMFYIIH